MRNVEWYHQGELYTKIVLNSIDIKDIAEKENCKTINSLISKLEELYDGTDHTNNEYMEGFLFNQLGKSEFIDYLYERYDKSFNSYDITTTYINFK